MRFVKLATDNNSEILVNVDNVIAVKASGVEGLCSLMFPGWAVEVVGTIEEVAKKLGLRVEG